MESAAAGQEHRHVAAARPRSADHDKVRDDSPAPHRDRAPVASRGRAGAAGLPMAPQAPMAERARAVPSRSVYRRTAARNRACRAHRRRSGQDGRRHVAGDGRPQGEFDDARGGEPLAKSTSSPSRTTVGRGGRDRVQVIQEGHGRVTRERVGDARAASATCASRPGPGTGPRVSSPWRTISRRGDAVATSPGRRASLWTGEPARPAERVEDADGEGRARLAAPSVPCAESATSHP